jgi:hypothetical protein
MSMPKNDTIPPVGVSGKEGRGSDTDEKKSR